ncbi:AcrR family transcriptional regulator [Paenibacillus mucilaginosus]|uniref:TetR/AcrR family transcriptional regulator n=1 Tax=Paenibacillus mucilaginosus TaxID=61624 RepID=UPI003D1D5689
MARPNLISKAELLQAARICLAEKGIEKTTLKAIADEAKVSQGTVYYHFRTKDQLMLELTQSLCAASWQSQNQHKESGSIEEALQGAKDRCGYDSFYHRLFFTSMAASFQSEPNRERLGAMLREENEQLAGLLCSRWNGSPVDGIPLEHWGVLINAMVDGLAVQALLDKDFPKDAVFNSLGRLLHAISGGVNNHEL